MPILIWSTIAGALGLVSGLIYEKESNKQIVEQASGNPNLTFWDKTLMAAAGIAAYWIYRTTK